MGLAGSGNDIFVSLQSAAPVNPVFVDSLENSGPLLFVGAEMMQRLRLPAPSAQPEEGPQLGAGGGLLFGRDWGHAMSRDPLQALDRQRGPLPGAVDSPPPPEDTLFPLPA